MTLTEKEIYDLNNMNVAAQNISLGTTISNFSGSIIEIDNTIEEFIGALKVHRSASLVFALADTWEDIEFDLMIDSETTDAFSYYDQGEVTEDKSIIVCNKTGIYWVGGCFHPYWSGGNAVTSYLAGRVITSDDNGSTWDEKRCFQTLNYSSKNTGDYLTQPYIGTAYFTQGEWIKLQGRADSLDIALKGNETIFDNSVAVTPGIYGGSTGSIT